MYKESIGHSEAGQQNKSDIHVPGHVEHFTSIIVVFAPLSVKKAQFRNDDSLCIQVTTCMVQTQ